MMHMRKKQPAEVSLEETLEPQSEDGPKKDIGTRDDVLHGSIDRIVLEGAIANLPPGYRIIFVLHDVEGYEHNEIAEMLGCSIGNSKSQLHKARMKLRTLLPQLKGRSEKTREVDRQTTAASMEQLAAGGAGASLFGLAARLCHDKKYSPLKAERLSPSPSPGGPTAVTI